MPVGETVASPSLLIARYRIPTITAYNRLEASPRTPDFSRSLRAEVHDALWMLTRQWQFGEFQGEDAGTPVTAGILARHTPMDRLAYPSGEVAGYDASTPLETVVERETVRPDLFLAVQMGRAYAKFLHAGGLTLWLPRFIVHYPLIYSLEENDSEGRQLLQAVEGRILDGCSLHHDFVTIDAGETQSRFFLWLDAPENADIPGADRDKLVEAARELHAWRLRIYSEPTRAESAWVPSNLEYRVTVASAGPPAQQVLSASQYSGGHLDWYSFDLSPGDSIPAPKETPATTGAEEKLSSFIPSPVAFPGMPNPRFWMMEESRTNFGMIDTSTTGLLHLLFAEFGLVYSNAWFLLPYPLPINTLCEVEGIVVTDVFGQHIFVRPAGKGRESDWQRWALFHHTEAGTEWASASRFYLAPAITRLLQGDPLEEVVFLRDETANMVWAVETTAPSQAGEGVDGNAMAIRKHPFPPFVPAGQAAIRYVLGTEVPDNWIPFLALHLEGSNTEIRLQRARMPGGRGPLGAVLSEVPAPYFVFEEEVPRAGVIVQRTFQRARWLNGKTFLWLGRTKETGRGEGWSNLAFDQIVDIPKGGDS